MVDELAADEAFTARTTRAIRRGMVDAGLVTRAAGVYRRGID